ncbi:sensor domain-containing protein [Nocardioides sp. BP30]|uniref:sensor histidine kinase n=1 Tax=Nocardioides sp. BP30 TaxID=3036374 RepID=UPI0024689E76|nr:sensor domain-containing protein [Nocardioides sp. BP30]WGL53761.1 sensor domain-containing protein [Nocardioides sp. BP30]
MTTVPVSADLPAERPGGLPADPPVAGRVRLTLYAGGQLLMWAPTLAAFVLTVVGGALSVICIGLVIVPWSLPVLRWLADRHRAMAARTLGVPVPGDHLPVPAGTHFIGRVVIWARDPMTWREFAWALVSLTLGFALALLEVMLLLCVVTGILWWFGTEPIMRARARLDGLFLSYGRTELLEQRVAVLTESRAEVADHSAAELRRLERDLHDGAQARLVALSMSLGMADEAFDADPERARRLVSEARATTTAALGDLRSVVRGIHPPVLADRGLAGAVEALALDLPLPVEVEARLDGRPPAPVESALYFAVAECLANVGKHAAAEHAWVRMRHRDGMMRAIVGDDGRGGADPTAGSGMLGVMRRLAAFDGTMSVASPAGGPTIITLEVPCALSSPKTTPSSGPG